MNTRTHLALVTVVIQNPTSTSYLGSNDNSWGGGGCLVPIYVRKMYCLPCTWPEIPSIQSSSVLYIIFTWNFSFSEWYPWVARLVFSRWPWSWSINLSYHYIHMYYRCILSNWSKLLLRDVYIQRVGVTKTVCRIMRYCYSVLLGLICIFQLYSLCVVKFHDNTLFNNLYIYHQINNFGLHISAFGN